MFFSWYIKNKNFKQKINLSGQIVPFLLVIVVVLLIAALAVVQIGRVSIDKTATANAADAGSLAAASSWASALNSLTFDNLNLYRGFDFRKYLVSATLIPQANYYLALSALYNEASYQDAELTAVYIAAGMLPAPCVELVPLLMAGAYAAYAMDYANKALTNMQSYLQLLIFIKAITEECYNNQLQIYQDILARMDEAYRNAKKEGFRFAFMNSGITSKLSKKQGDDFNLFLDKTIVEGVDAGQDTLQVDWTDKIGRAHIVSVTVDLPNIETYGLWCTTLTYAQMQALYDKIINKVNVSLVNLQKALTSLYAVIAGLGVIVVTATVICVLFCIPPFGTIAASAMAIAKTAAMIGLGAGIAAYISYAFAIFYSTSEDGNALENIINNTLIDQSWDCGKLVGNAITDKFIYPDVRSALTKEEFLAEIAGGPWSGVSDYIKIMYPYGAKTLQDLMIVGIDTISLKSGKSWKAKVTTIQTHPVVDIGSGAMRNVSTTSSSSSQFSGGSMNLNFDVIKADPVHALDTYPDITGSRRSLENVTSIIKDNIRKWDWYENKATTDTLTPPTPDVLEKEARDVVDANYSPQIVEVE